MITKFYEKILPTKGNKYCVAWTSGKGMNHEWVDYIKDIEPTIKDLQSKNKDINIYVAMSSFEGQSRLAKHATYRKSLFVDLDVGKDKAESGKGYATKEEAEKALDDFVEKTLLPPVIKLDSGNGIHGYWPLQEELTIKEWEPYAEKFFNFCLEHKLLVDSSVMCDAARIMRSPDSINYKKGKEPAPAKLLTEEIHEYPLELIKDRIGEVEVSLDVILKDRKLTNDQRKALKLDNFQSVFSTIAKKSLRGKDGCNQIKHILMNATMLEEPLWYAGLSIAQHCKDRDTAIHLMSENHKDYDPDITEAKATQSQDKPFSCEKFNDLNPTGCDGCSHRGKITNPLAIGKEFVPAPTTEMTPVEQYKQGGTLLSLGGLPKDLHPFVYGGADGGIYFEHPQEMDEDGQALPRKKPMLVSPYDLYPINRIYSATEGECLNMMYHPPNDKPREFMMPMEHLYDPTRFKQIVLRNGVFFDPNNQQGRYLMTYIYRWGDYLLSKSKAEIMRTQMGWTPDKDAFVIGNKEIDLKGNVVNSPTSPLCKGIAQHLNTEGSYQEWKNTANKLDTPSLELHAFTMLTGFGSVLMEETTTNGMTVCLTGTDSGSGKTGALQAALSIWGNPEALKLTQGGATENALTARYLAFHNLPFGLDEVGNIEGRALSNLIHKISNGKAKVRMQASVNAEREYEMSASLIALFTSNHSLYNTLQTVKKNPHGEVARLLEITVNKPKIFFDDPTAGASIFQPYNHHYGHAGFDFINKLFGYSKEEIRIKIDKWLVKFKKDFGDDTTYRFHENMIACTFAAGEIAVENDIVDLDLVRIYTATVSELINIRDNVIGRINEVDYESMLGEYINAHNANILALEVNENNKVNQEPRGELLIRAEIDTAKMFIEKRHFREYLGKAGISVSDFILKMKAKGYNIRDHKRRMGTGWKAATGFSSVMALEIDTTKFLEDLIKESNETK
mgnify:FL=1